MPTTDAIAEATALVDCAPCQVVLPAGCGKTHLAAAAAGVAVSRGQRVLVLTHTHAAVDAVRRRIKTLGVDSSQVVVSTIAGWFLRLVAAYPKLSGHQVGEVPDFGAVDAGAAQLLASQHILAMIQASYSLVIVDEYQDCCVGQHAALMRLTGVVPVVVLGDPLQSVLDFSSATLIDWDVDLVTFPALDLEVRPWRWSGSNEALGEFTLAIRQSLLDGTTIDLATGPLEWQPIGDKAIRNAMWASTRFGGDTVALYGAVRAQSLKMAKSVSGAFGVMETIEGKPLLDVGDAFDGHDTHRAAASLIYFAADCFCGLSGLKAKAEAIETGAFPRFVMTGQLGPALGALQSMVGDPCPPNILTAIETISSIPGAKLVCREAWYGLTRAVKVQSSDSAASLSDAVRQVRDRVRRYGRVSEQRVVSRVPLFKGQECGRCIAVIPHGMKVPDMYVAMTRGTHQLVVLSESSVLNG